MDVLGQAISDHFNRVRGGKLWVHTRTTAGGPEAWQTFPREEMPVRHYFRSSDDMPELEWTAMRHCRGRILDIGAGAGSHSLALQQLGQDVTALEISPLAAEVIRGRGVGRVVCGDILLMPAKRKYDTLLLMMNGIGVAGNLVRLRAFLRKARALTRPGATVLFDSTDISYLFKEMPPPPGYYGELLYRYEYRKQLSEPFPWLFIDRITLRKIAAEEGWQMKILFEDRKGHYLAALNTSA